MSEDHPPARRFGLEQELFVVDESAALKDEAGHLLERCRAAAVAAGLDPGCFKGECVESLVEVTTPPCSSFDGLVASWSLRPGARSRGPTGPRRPGSCARSHPPAPP
jgi:gamma-glutamyl:cysteine ligase YbdK (ATP-grasp superfamily)